jgi:DNA anti-recombination protein RmuC
MDIENLRKIQETEKILRIHNINISTDDALQAIKNDVTIGNTKIPTFEDVADIPSNQILREKEEAQQSQKEVREMDNQTATDLKKQIEEQSALISKQAQLINQLQGVVNDIIREINKMQNTVPTKNPAERQQVLKSEERTQHPRSGGYKPEDVSVDKFFNFSGTR